MRISRTIVSVLAATLASWALGAIPASAAEKPVATQASYVNTACCQQIVSPGTSQLIAVLVMLNTNSVVGAQEEFSQVDIKGTTHTWLSVPPITGPKGIAVVGYGGSYSEPVTLTAPATAAPGTYSDIIVFHATAKGEHDSVVSAPLTFTVTG
jgi:hypothetical protein